MKTRTTDTRLLTALIYAFTVIAILFIIAAFTGCTSQSGKLMQTPLEKVVIVDSYPSVAISVTKDGRMYHYKVNRISKGVVTAIYDYNLYEKGDTIFHRFINE